jgi:hypothetical protein
MKSPLLVGLIWFLLFAILPAAAAALGHNLNYWFIGWLVIDAASAFVIGRAIALGRSNPADRAAPPASGVPGAAAEPKS